MAETRITFSQILTRAMLSQDTIRLLFEKLRYNLSLEEIIFNTRILANFFLGRKTLSFNLKPVR
ncbi:MAG TPA: hypothetical protein VNE86_08150 [Nitrososphaerales archaeon]|nr:hypothetical protein [Nitrososphaerales archaeon]